MAIYKNYKPGDKIHILPKDKMGYPRHLNHSGKMDKWIDTIATVASGTFDDCVKIIEDGGSWYWHVENIEPHCVVEIDNDTLINFL